MNFRQTIVAQFKKPHGGLGRVAGWIMANRRSNRQRNVWTVELLQLRSHDRVPEHFPFIRDCSGEAILIRG